MTISTTLKNTPKNWFKFVRFTKNYDNLNFRWERLPGFIFEEFLNFQYNYYVTQELTHIVAGIYKKPEAIKEYKEIAIRESLKPSRLHAMYCLNNKNNGIIAINSLRLYRKGDPFNDIVIQGKTEEVNRLFKIDYELNKLCPISDIMTKYDVDTYFHEDGTAVKPEFRGLGILYEINQLRENHIYNMYGPSLRGGWCTSFGTQRAAHKLGWELEYEVSTKDLEKLLKVTFNNAPPTFQYRVKKSDPSSTQAPPLCERLEN